MTRLAKPHGGEPLTVLETDLIPTTNRIPQQPQNPDGKHLSLEPTAGLEWSQAIELPKVAGSAHKPSEIRKAWVHRAPERKVLALYRAVRESDQGSADVPAPWWLRALARGELASRAAGFRVEDRIAQLLGPRTGWVFVPWVDEGESGYWEYMPSERGPSGHTIPTTLVNTDRHPGWIDIQPAYSGSAPAPVPVAGLAGLRSRLGEFEAMR
jgi:hypothetical protein